MIFFLLAAAAGLLLAFNILWYDQTKTLAWEVAMTTLNIMKADASGMLWRPIKEDICLAMRTKKALAPKEVNFEKDEKETQEETIEEVEDNVEPELGYEDMDTIFDDSQNWEDEIEWL